MIYFTSDTHVGHKNIISFCERPFESTEHMNEALVYNWNSTVKPEDTVYHLGDVSFMNKQKTLDICHRLNGNKKLIMGNHDLNRDVNFWYECGFAEVWRLGYGATVEAEGFTLCHYPYRKDLSEYDHREYLYHHAPEPKGVLGAGTLVLLHGHVHRQWKTKYGMINVGVDVWDLKPVSIDVLQEIQPLT